MSKEKLGPGEEEGGKRLHERPVQELHVFPKLVAIQDVGDHLYRQVDVDESHEAGIQGLEFSV